MDQHLVNWEEGVDENVPYFGLTYFIGRDTTIKFRSNVIEGRARCEEGNSDGRPGARRTRMQKRGERATIKQRKDAVNRWCW